MIRMKNEQHVQSAFEHGRRFVALFTGFIELVEEGTCVGHACRRCDEGATLADAVSHGGKGDGFADEAVDLFVHVGEGDGVSLGEELLPYGKRWR